MQINRKVHERHIFCNEDIASADESILEVLQERGDCDLITLICNTLGQDLSSINVVEDSGELTEDMGEFLRNHTVMEGCIGSLNIAIIVHQVRVGVVLSIVEPAHNCNWAGLLVSLRSESYWNRVISANK